MYEGWRFPHESLGAYRDAVEFLRLVRGWKWPRGCQELQRQLDRAALSVVLNVCEGRNQKYGGNSGKNFYRIALGSAGECHGALEVHEVLTGANHARERRVLQKVGAQVSGLAR